MKPTLRLQSIKLQAETIIPNITRDVSGLTEQRQRTVRALEETREARRTGEIEQAVLKVVEQIEQGLTGIPEPGPSGVVTARVVASGNAKTEQPAVPLAGLIVQLKVKEAVVEQKETNQFGLVTFEPLKAEEGSYQIEVLGPRGSVIAHQQGRWGPKQAPMSHLMEVARSEELKPQLERAAIFEEVIKQAHARADIAQDVTVKALDAQEQKLIEYLAEIDDELKCEHPTELEGTQVSNQQAEPRSQTQQQPEPVKPLVEQSPPQAGSPKSEEKSKPEAKLKTETKPTTETSPKEKSSDTKQRRKDKKKSM